MNVSYWNGALPPLGYRIVAAEQRGAKIKKKLEIDPIHAETVRLIYRLALKGEGDSGRIGLQRLDSADGQAGSGRRENQRVVPDLGEKVAPTIVAKPSLH